MATKAVAMVSDSLVSVEVPLQITVSGYFDTQLSFRNTAALCLCVLSVIVV